MRYIKKSLWVALSLAALLAGCKTVDQSTASAASNRAAAQAPAVQAANVEVFMAARKALKGYRPIRLNDKQTIYISPAAVVERSHVTAIDIVKDQKNRIYVKLTLNPQGVALISKVPAGQGYATAVGGKLASLSGVRQGSDFLFSVRDQQTAGAIVRAIVPQQATR